MFFLGANYRTEWSVPVRMPVFNLVKDPRGFKIQELGGGQQTKSLDLVDRSGREWSLRSVDKDVEKALPKGLKSKLVRNLVQDLISASYPYGGLSVPALSQATNVYEGDQQLYYVPNDPAFGQYQTVMANTVCLLVLKQPAGIDLEKSEEILPKLESGNYVVDQEALLRARLLDWVMGDWDRHEDQWRWTTRDSAGLKWFYPMPRDRDQVFFYSDGLLVQMLTRFFMPHVNGFDKRAHSIRRLGYKTRAFDLGFLNGLDRGKWVRVIREFQQNLNDTVIERALRQQPREIYEYSGRLITAKLKSRRDQLMSDALNYYEYLAKQVSIFASFRNDQVMIDQQGDQTIITIYNHAAKPVYHRAFDPKETKMVLVDGLEGNDRFLIEEPPEGIKLLLYGGKGEDVYPLQVYNAVRIKDEEEE